MSDPALNDAEAFARLVEALRPWHDHLVIVGGWAHRLHRLHAFATVPPHPPLHTTEADVAFSATAPLAGSVGKALREAGFTEDFLGEDRPPVTHYALGGEHQAFYAEFLAPLTGSGLRRTGEPDVTMRRAGVTAQKLRHLDMLLLQPWLVQLEGDSAIPLASAAEIQVANPVSFIAQKLLIRDKRAPHKQAQDALYVHDTLELFGHRLEQLRAIWHEQLRPAVGSKRAAEIDRLWREQFGVVDDVIRSAARLQTGRELKPERVQQVCAYGLERVFGPEQTPR